MRKLAAILVLGLALGAGVVIVDEGPAIANHTGCNQIDGNDGPNNLNGTSGCDEMWAYGGHDVFSGWGSGDELHMGGDYDWAFGNDGGDLIFGGDNGANTDEMFGGAGSDTIKDNETDGMDLACGGNDNDNLNTYDQDNNDALIGEGGASDDLWDGPDGDHDGDTKRQDGVCV